MGEVDQKSKQDDDESNKLPKLPSPSTSSSVDVPVQTQEEEDAIQDMVIHASAPPWFTPKRLLVIFCVVNLLNYVDRGAIASNGVNGNPSTCTKNGICSGGTGIQGDFKLSNFQDGVVSSAFMVGLLVASPIFASLSKRVNPFRLIGVGLSVWTIATAGCGFSFSFWSISICRMLVGVGEASFISLAAPFIDDNAPVTQKTAWLGIFYMCIPSGVALGYVYGGLVGGHLNWRYAFFGESILMLPFAILGFVMKPLQLKGFSRAGSREVLTAVETAELEDQDAVVPNGKNGGSTIRAKELNQFSIFWRDLKEIMMEKVFVMNVLGYIAYNFVIGAYSYWGPKAGYNIYHMENADMVFGGITILCGVLGTLAGGFVLDHMTATLPNAFKLLSAATFFGAICCFGAFCFESLYGFVALFSIGELLVFATQGPVNYVCLHSVKPGLRPLSMAMSTVAIHIFGDVPSSPLVGILQDHLHNWRATALILTSIMFVAALIWFIGIFIHSEDQINEESEQSPVPVTVSTKSNTTPLLEEKTAELTSCATEP